MSKQVNPAYPVGDACGECGHKVQVHSIEPNAEEAICDKCGWSYYRENL